MFYLNHELIFALYYLIFVWVKCFVNIMRFVQLRTSQDQECFSKKYQTSFLALLNFL